MTKSKSILASALIAAIAAPAFAEYPEKPVTFVVPWPPGDLEDVLTRMIAEDFKQHTEHQQQSLTSQAAVADRSQARLKWQTHLQMDTWSALS